MAGGAAHGVFSRESGKTVVENIPADCGELSYECAMVGAQGIAIETGWSCWLTMGRPFGAGNEGAALSGECGAEVHLISRSRPPT